MRQISTSIDWDSRVPWLLTFLPDHLFAVARLNLRAA